jgi:2-methylcitrate dehydratase
MAVLRSNAPATGGVREFDPEIKDMASYVHNYKIDSDLAVRCLLLDIDRQVWN